MGELLLLILIFVFLIVPLILTFFNILNLFKKKKIKENIVDILTFVLGIGFTFVLYFLFGFRDYNEALILGGGEVDAHAPIASWSMLTVISIFFIGVISYVLIRIKN